MGTTLLARKANQTPVTPTDDVYNSLAADATVTEFPQGTNYTNFVANPQIVSQSGATQMQNTMPAQQVVRTTAGDNAGQNAESLVKADENWVNKRWRPAMGWTYMAVCIFDFILFPILYSIVQFWETQAANDAFRQWEPLTLQGAGLFHMAMGAVLGIAVYGRTKEKVEGKN